MQKNAYKETFKEIQEGLGFFFKIFSLSTMIFFFAALFAYYTVIVWLA